LTKYGTNFNRATDFSSATIYSPHPDHVGFEASRNDSSSNLLYVQYVQASTTVQETVQETGQPTQRQVRRRLKKDRKRAVRDQRRRDQRQQTEEAFRRLKEAKVAGKIRNQLWLFEEYIV